MYCKKYKGATALFLLIICLQYSCTTIIATAYGVNKNHTFKNSDEYLAFANKQNEIPKTALLHMDSFGSAQLRQYFITKESNNGYFLGTYINDTTKIKESADLQADENCWGRITGDLDSTIRVGILNIYKDTFLKNKRLYYFQNGNPYYFANNNKLKILLLYTSSFGRLYKSNYKHIIDFVRKNSNKTELVVISLDYGYDGKNEGDWK